MSQQPESKEPRKVVEAEIISPDTEQKNHYHRNSHYQSQSSFNAVWIPPSLMQSGGCIGALISMVLFLICLVHYGILAGIGFLVFNIIGSVLGTVYQTRKLMAGVVVSPWVWRVGVWFVAILLTAWLAGSFHE